MGGGSICESCGVGCQSSHIAVYPHASAREEGADFPGVVSSRAHLFMVGVYGDQPHQNYGVYFGRVIMNNATW